MSRILPFLMLVLSSLLQAGETQYQALALKNGESAFFAVHLPDGYDAANVYPVLIGPGDGVEIGNVLGSVKKAH